MQRFVIKNVQIDNNKKAAENYISPSPHPPPAPTSDCMLHDILHKKKKKYTHETKCIVK